MRYITHYVYILVHARFRGRSMDSQKQIGRVEWKGSLLPTMRICSSKIHRFTPMLDVHQLPRVCEGILSFGTRIQVSANSGLALHQHA